jgi:hypothetical protein
MHKAAGKEGACQIVVDMDEDMNMYAAVGTGVDMDEDMDMGMYRGMLRMHQCRWAWLWQRRLLRAWF